MARQVACFLLPVFFLYLEVAEERISLFPSRIVVLIYPVHYGIDRFESVVPTGFHSPALALMFRSPNHPSNIPRCCI